MESRAVLIPVKAFTDAKGRLAPSLGDERRAGLARRLASAVVEACSALDVFVVCEDAAVADWARQIGASVIENGAPGLDAAVRHGMAELAHRSVDRVLVTHADLVVPAALPELFAHDGIVLVPDARLDGTNALVVDPRLGFSFSYGPGSFARHLSEAERLPVPLHVVRGTGLELDVDEPADLALLDRELQRPRVAS